MAGSSSAPSKQAVRIPEFRGSIHRQFPELARWSSQYREDPLDPGLPIIDAHHHLVDDERGRYTAEEFMEDVHSGHNIVATVYMQHKAMYRSSGPQALRPVGEVEYVNGIAAASASGRYGAIRLCEGIVGHANLMLGDEVQPVLEALQAAAPARFCGVRHVAAWDEGSASVMPTAPRHMLLEPLFRRGFACLQPLGLSFETYLYYPQLGDLAHLLAAFPDTQVVLNHLGGHLGIPPYVQPDKVFASWKASVTPLAAFPNLKVKLGGLGMLYSGWGFHLRERPPTSVELAKAWQPYMETCISAFGADRCMFESNFPMDKQSCGYGVLWNAFKRITQTCSAQEKAALYHNTAVRSYRLPRETLHV